MKNLFHDKWYIPFIGAAAVAFLFARFGHWFDIGGMKGALCGGVAGFIGSCVLMLFEWLESTSTAAKQTKYQQKEEERKLFDGFPEQSSSNSASLLAILMFIIACVTFWIPVLGIAITSYAVYLAGREDLPGWIGCLGVCLLLASIAATIAGGIISGLEFLT